jgi:hypothetical protein
MQKEKTCTVYSPDRTFYAFIIESHLPDSRNGIPSIILHPDQDVRDMFFQVMPSGPARRVFGLTPMRWHTHLKDPKCPPIPSALSMTASDGCVSACMIALRLYNSYTV